MVQQCSTRSAAQFAFVREFLVRGRTTARRHRTCNYAVVLPRRDHGFQSWTGTEGNKGRSCEGPERASRRTGPHRPFESFLRATPHFGDGADCAFVDVAFLCRIVLSWCTQSGRT